VWTPPQWVCGPWVIGHSPQVWTPPHWVCGPAETGQPAQVWTPPQWVTGPRETGTAAASCRTPPPPPKGPVCGPQAMDWGGRVPGQPGPPPDAAQIGLQVWNCVTWQITAQDSIPPHWVAPPQVMSRQVAPQVWTPPQADMWPQVTAQVAPQVWTPPQCVTGPQEIRQVWQVTPQVWMPPQTVCPPQVRCGAQVWAQVCAQVLAQVWTPAQCVTGPQVICRQVAPQVWMPPQTVCPPQVMLGAQVWPMCVAQMTQTDAPAVRLPPGGQPAPQVWMPPQAVGPPEVGGPPWQRSWVSGPCMNWVNGFTIFIPYQKLRVLTETR